MPDQRHLCCGEILLWFIGFYNFFLQVEQSLWLGLWFWQPSVGCAMGNAPGPAVPGVEQGWQCPGRAEGLCHMGFVSWGVCERFAEQGFTPCHLSPPVTFLQSTEPLLWTRSQAESWPGTARSLPPPAMPVPLSSFHNSHLPHGAVNSALRCWIFLSCL